ncbi:MAG: thiamine-monophosphate kinase, partial [Actinomycetota bacterium]|nr:thiamine-monophosphate kinase [Actinomycetota bacterium]
MDVGEQELLTAIGKVLSGAGPEVLVGIGDDAAVVRAGPGDQVITTDAMVEGTHFDRGRTSARDLGYKAVVVNLSDIAAMGASPRTAVCALTLTDDVDAAWTMELFGGMRDACDEHALWMVGGNLAKGREVSVAITVVGEVATGRAVGRGGAREGDVIVITGSLGGSAAGLRLADAAPATWSDADRDALRLHFRPAARVAEGQALANAGATAMIDVSDGLSLDLSRLCLASNLAATLDAAAVPVHPAATPEEALNGGEDYELLATVGADVVAEITTDLDNRSGTRLTLIGRMG